jgi:hypothetical protein
LVEEFGLVIWLAPTFQRLVIPTIGPGGLWIRPIQGEIIKDILHFAAHAYPTRTSDPAIDHVNFTIILPGLSYWRIACTVRPTAGTDIFACDVKLKDLQAAAGEARVSFDVYDIAGNVNKAPNGEHTILYAPS